MERESIEYRGKMYHRYPESKRPHLRNYYWHHGKWKEPPVALHKQVYIDIYGPIPEGMQIHHKDGDFLNNSPENLECLSAKEHVRHHPISEEQRELRRERGKREDKLGKWRQEHPEEAKKLWERNAKYIKKAQEASMAAREERKRIKKEARRQEIIEQNRDAWIERLNKWRRENPELCRQHASAAGKKAAAARLKKKRESLQLNGS